MTTVSIAAGSFLLRINTSVVTNNVFNTPFQLEVKALDTRAWPVLLEFAVIRQVQRALPHCEFSCLSVCVSVMDRQLFSNSSVNVPYLDILPDSLHSPQMPCIPLVPSTCVYLIHPMCVGYVGCTTCQ